MTTRCPCSTEELQALANGPLSLRQVVVGRVLDARKRGINEKRNAGMPMGARLDAETAENYFDRMIGRQQTRDARAGGSGQTTHRGRVIRPYADGKLSPRENRYWEEKTTSAEEYVDNLQMAASWPITGDGPFRDSLKQLPPALPGETLRDYRRRTSRKDNAKMNGDSPPRRITAGKS